jgi:hypothetical protein
VATVTDYDERAIVATLDAAPVLAKVRFAAACAERLVPVYQRFCDSTGQGDVHVLRGALDLAWSLGAGGSAARQAVSDAQTASEALVPHDDDDDWVFASAYAQNAAAAVAYALRTWLADSAQEAAWAARQVYEAADYGAEAADGEGAQVVEEVLAAIAADLRAAGDETVSVEELRAGAARGGARLAEQLPGS